MGNPDVKTLRGSNYGKQSSGESFVENHNGKPLRENTYEKHLGNFCLCHATMQKP